ncbi:hypothetical protein IJ472_03585 [bacterium]|nr:hypothetical protein [bacterium]
MYIFELIAQYLKPKKYTAKYSYDPLNENEVDEDSENCEHLFLPLDSSNEHFACKYCGLVVPKEQLKNKNIFENKSF